MAQLESALYALVCTSAVWWKNISAICLLAGGNVPAFLRREWAISIDRDQEILMTRFTDQKYLKTDQYKDATNLDARVEIHRRFSTNSYGWFNWVFDTLLKLP